MFAPAEALPPSPPQRTPPPPPRVRVGHPALLAQMYRNASRNAKA
jgi:hypothetical protein